MIRIQIVLRSKDLNGCKGTIKNRQDPRKYEILTDDSVITRSRRHVKAYFDKVRESE